MSAGVLKARKQSAAEFVKHFSTTIQDYDFPVGSLVLVRNSRIEKELNRKMKPRFLGPMVVVHQTQGGAYILAELNGTVSRLQYATFCIIPYLARFPDHIPVTALMDEAKLEDVQICSESFPPADDPSEEVLSMNKFLLKLPPCHTLPFLLVINILHPSQLRQSHIPCLSRPDTSPPARLFSLP